MTQVQISFSYAIETDSPYPELEARFNNVLAGQIKDRVAQALAGLEFDLTERYWLLSPAASPEETRRPRSSPQTIAIWSPEEESYIEVNIGSAAWFALIENKKKFFYRYGDLTFTVRYEPRKSRGKIYYYWRAYATVKGRLRAKQIGKTESLTQEALDAVGVYFEEQSRSS